VTIQLHQTDNYFLFKRACKKIQIDLIFQTILLCAYK